MKVKTFEFTVTGFTVLEVSEIWPDGDAPEDPTVEDVLAMISKFGGSENFISECGLANGLTLTVDGEYVPRTPRKICL